MMKIKLLMMVLFGWLVIGCTINQDHLAGAIEACKDHEGVFKITIDSPFVDVTCKDGTYIDDVRGDK